MKLKGKEWRRGENETKGKGMEKGWEWNYRERNGEGVRMKLKGKEWRRGENKSEGKEIEKGWEWN